MRDKIAAAKRLVDALETDMDFFLYLMDHPNTERATARLLADVEKCSVTDEDRGNRD